MLAGQTKGQIWLNTFFIFTLQRSGWHHCWGQILCLFFDSLSPMV